MSSPGRVRQLWYRWKSLKLPWRKQVLVGFDLGGNTFWEFGDPITQRTRRIVKYGRKTHYGDVKVTPQWLQWLRHTRFDPPSIVEQEQDLVRQAQMKQLAALADERWASKPSVLDPPQKQQPTPAIASHEHSMHPTETTLHDRPGVHNAVSSHEKLKQTVGAHEDPAKWSTMGKERHSPSAPQKQRAKGGDEWQPAPWTPSSVRRRS